MALKKTTLAVIGLVSALGLTGCERQSVSYGITNRNHSMSLIIEKPYVWSKEYTQNVIIGNMPECQRRYRLDPVRVTPNYRVQIFDFGTYTHLWLMPNRAYIFDHFHCTFEPRDRSEFEGLQAVEENTDYIGYFYLKDDKLDFRNIRKERMDREAEEEKRRKQQELPAEAPQQPPQIDSDAYQNDPHRDIMPY